MENYRDRLMSKNGKVTMSLSREMIYYSEGDRIKTIDYYTKYFNTGRGTVQAALKFLQESNAIKLESRGHLGTFITRIDYDKLWTISDFGTVMGVMPLPYSKRYEGLATGFYKAFEKANVPFSLAFMRGATKRIEALKLGKYNFAIISKLAATLEIRKSSSIDIIHEFGEGSYVANHVVIFRDKAKTKIEDGMRVALDPSSIDQIILTSYECEGKDVNYIETSYTQIIQKLSDDEIDAAIWNADEVMEKNLDFNICKLNNPKTKELDRDDTIAVMVIDRDSMDFGNILKRFIDMRNIEITQRKVLNKEITPIY